MENQFWTDPSQNYIERYPRPLDAIFLPKTIAVIGAKDEFGTVGRTIMLNLTTGGYKGKIYPVNPKRKEVIGITCYSNLKEIPEPIDLCIIITPAKTVPGIIRECVQTNVKSIIIISAGFKEFGAEGEQLEREVLKESQGKIPIIGPNCLGVMNPLIGLNATFAKGMALPGNIAFISQSGAMCSAVLDWSLQEKIGFSSFVSIGSMADVNWGDLIDYLGGDPSTHSILMYMESIGDARSFLSAAREIALEKPIIIIKPGRSAEAAKAAASHTGSLAGSDEVLDMALQRVGVLRVDTISQLFNMASVLGRQPRPKGPNLTIITNAGGPSVLATDATVLNGAKLSPLERETIDKLETFLPPAWSHANPVDILGDASASRYLETLEVLAKDNSTDGLLVILSPQDMTDPIGVAEGLRGFSKLKDKPVLTSWMGGSFVKKGIEILNQANIPTFEYPDDAAWSFATMWKYAENLKRLYETPLVKNNEGKFSHNSALAKEIIEKVKLENRTLLTEFESKKLLSYYGIPIVETKIATTIDEAIQYADEIGYPIVMKLHSETITHKSDVGGVKLNIVNRQDVEKNFKEIQGNILAKFTEKDFQGVTIQKMIKLEGIELIIGSIVDPQFGPVLLFGAGGIFVEVFKDKALGLPPLNTNLVKHMINKTKISNALEGIRGKKGIDMVFLEKILINFSQMIVENPWIKECDINPLLASADGIIALDARIVLHPLDTPKNKLPLPALRPYPVEYVFYDKTKEQKDVTIRPIRPEDEAMMVEFHKKLSENTVRQRYFAFLSLNDRIAHERLIRICLNDFDREIAIVAIIDDQIVGVARLARLIGTDIADLKLTIVDEYQNKGIGELLLTHILEIAKQENVKQIDARILSENIGMIYLVQKKGFQLYPEEEDRIMHAILTI